MYTYIYIYIYIYMIDLFLFKNKRKKSENEIWEQFVRNSRYIMEPQLRFGYKKTHSTIFFFYIHEINN